MDKRIPVTVLTGYLGAGKTTLLNRILSEDHGHRYAVIVNEFGEIGIDTELVTHASEELFEMNNGCICCTVRGDLIRTLHTLLNTLLQRPGTFDAVVVETSGLADPGPVAQTFFVDPKLRAALRLDSITTLVDARHVRQQLLDSREAAEQIAFADQLVLNKTDLVTADELNGLARLLQRMNPLAPVHRALRSQLPLHQVLGRGGFDLDRITTLEPGFLASPHVHDEHCDHGHEQHHDHQHDSGISSVALSSALPMDAVKVQAWLAQLVAARGAQILRAKGIFDIAGDARRMVFQSVHMVLEGDWQRCWREGEHRHSRLVFIGRQLDGAALQAGLDRCAAGVG